MWAWAPYLRPYLRPHVLGLEIVLGAALRFGTSLRFGPIDGNLFSVILTSYIPHTPSTRSNFVDQDQFAAWLYCMCQENQKKMSQPNLPEFWWVQVLSWSYAILRYMVMEWIRNWDEGKSETLLKYRYKPQSKSVFCEYCPHVNVYWLFPRSYYMDILTHLIYNEIMIIFYSYTWRTYQ